MSNNLKLNADWLKNNEAYDVPGTATFQKAKFNDYYINTCAYIYDHHYLRLSINDIATYIINGEVLIEEIKLTCPVKDAEERLYLFLSAQAKQLIYDFTNGRGAMIRGSDARFNTCRDFVDRIKLLGLYQRTQTTI